MFLNYGLRGLTAGPRLLLLLGLWASGGQARAQVALLDKAFEMLQRKDYAKARQALDLVVRDSATARVPRTWFLRGFAYKELYKANPTAPEDLRAAALASLARCQQLDTDRKYAKDCQAATRYVQVSYYNEAINAFNQQQYAAALAGFEQYLKVKANDPPDDLTGEALYYAGYTSLATGQRIPALRYYERARELHYQSPLLYGDLTTLYNEENQPQRATTTIAEGRQRFPGDTTLRTVEINHFLGVKNYQRAQTLVEEFLKIDPSNVEVLLVAGTIYEKVAQTDTLRRDLYFQKRKEVFGRVLTQQPSNFAANYNLGITLYNRGVDLIKAQRYDLDIVLLYELLEKVSALFQEARPYVEKAYALSPNNRNAMRALEGIYYNLNEKEKSRLMRSKLNETK